VHETQQKKTAYCFSLPAAPPGMNPCLVLSFDCLAVVVVVVAARQAFLARPGGSLLPPVATAARQAAVAGGPPAGERLKD
jgi:hypothetical protein